MIYSYTFLSGVNVLFIYYIYILTVITEIDELHKFVTVSMI